MQDLLIETIILTVVASMIIMCEHVIMHFTCLKLLPIESFNEALHRIFCV